MKRLLTSCFGLGRLPVAPGTYGSVPVVIVFVLMYRFGASYTAVSVVMALLALVGSVICIRCAPYVIAATGKRDPREVVADEFAGQAVTFMVAGAVAGGEVWAAAVLGFLVFRFLDITKPWPIRKLERLPEGWGVLADDLMAGVYSGVILLYCLRTGLTEYLSESFGFSSGSLGFFNAAVLGTVQGVTEFLPVSSSGHLVLLETFFDFDPETPQMLLFDLAAHAGTVAAILVVFRKSIAAFFRNLVDCGKYGTGFLGLYRKSPSVRLLVLAVFAIVVTGVCGLLFEEYFISARGDLRIVLSMWIITGTLLLITDCRKKTRLGLRRFAVWQAAVVGLAQAGAIMPGLSRSGATICAAILIGLHRRWAVEFSFMIAIPVVLAATVVQLARNFGQISSGGVPLSSLLAGFAVAGFAGILALKLLIKTSRRANLKFFAFYCYALACFVLVYLLR